MRGLSILVILFFLVACASNQLVDDGSGKVRPPPPPEIRPDIPRVDVPPGDPIGTQESTRFGELQQFLDGGAQTGVRKAIDGFYVGGPGDPLLVGDTIGEKMPTLTKFELPWLVAPNPGYPGPEIPVQQFIRFYFEENDTGELRFERDPVTEEVTSHIFYAYKQPFMEYAYLLYASNFQAMEGLEISFFGDTYWVKEARPESIELYGVDVERHLVLRNDSTLWMNGKEYLRTRVEVSPWSIIIRYFADRPDDGGIRLFPGESLRGKLETPEMLFYDKFDIVYEGLESNADNGWVLNSVGDEVLGAFINILGAQIEFFTTCLPWGSDGEAFHVEECRSANDFCIAEDERFLITSQGGVSDIFEFRGVNGIGSVATFRQDGTQETHTVEIEGRPYDDDEVRVLEGELRYADSPFRVRIEYNESAPDRARLSMDQDGDRGISGKDIPMVLAQGYELRFGEGNASSCELDFVALPIIGHKDFRTEEVTRIFINAGLTSSEEDDMVYRLSTDLPLAQIGDEDDWAGKTERGVFVTLEDSDDGEWGETLLFDYPADFTSGLVRIVS